MKLNNTKRFFILLVAFFGLFFVVPKSSFAHNCSATEDPILRIGCTTASTPPNTCKDDSPAQTFTSISGQVYNGCCCPKADHMYGDAEITALGVLSTQADYLASDLLTFGLGIIGGVTLLLFLFGTIRYITSHGSPDAVAQAKGIITAAVTGAAVIVLAVLLLGLLGVNVIGIPGWKFNGTQLETPN